MKSVGFVIAGTAVFLVIALGLCTALNWWRNGHPVDEEVDE